MKLHPSETTLPFLSSDVMIKSLSSRNSKATHRRYCLISTRTPNSCSLSKSYDRQDNHTLTHARRGSGTPDKMAPNKSNRNKKYKYILTLHGWLPSITSLLNNKTEITIVHCASVEHYGMETGTFCRQTRKALDRSWYNCTLTRRKLDWCW